MRTSSTILRLLLVFALTFAAAVAGETAGERSLETARQWARSKFLGEADARAARPQMIVSNKAGRIDRNRIKGWKFRIANREYPGGIAMPLPGEVRVRLPGAGAVFEASVGVDGNDLGYYANAGRGSVVASVEAGGREMFRSGVLREGMPAVPVKAELGGAGEITLKLTAVGERSKTYQAEWDQADWAEAKVKLADGKVVRLADLPAGPLPGPVTAELPFSFRYDGRPSSEFLKTWKVRRTTRALDGHRTEYSLVYTDPKTGLEARCAGIGYGDYPVVEWTVYFRNTGTAPTPILERIEALDTGIERSAEGEFLLHHAKGSPNSPTDFQPLETTLEPKSDKRISAYGGRPTDTDLCYFNVEWAGNGVIVALGWPGQWAAHFVRDEARGLQIRAGQELTHFSLRPGEEVRSPLVALLFWEGDWIGAQNVWRRWMIADNLPRPGGRLPRPQIAGGANRQTIEMQDASEENQKFFLNRDLDAGLRYDYWWMDAGWYPFESGWWQTGTWEPDAKRFPHGLAAVSAAAHARHVKTLLWFEPERVAPGSWLSEAHPEWLLGPKDKDRLLDLGNPEAWRWLTEHISKVIREQGIDFYRQDFNFEPLSRWRLNEAEDRQGMHENRHVTGYLTYWDELRKRFPEMPIDTCASGGRRDDLETLRRAVPLWRSDYPYEPTAMQAMTYAMALWIPYFGTGVNSLDPYVFRSQMTPAVGIGFEAGRQPDGNQRLIALVEQWRAVSDYYYGDFYPLTPYSLERSTWMAWQFDRPEQGDGMVQAFRRPDCPFESGRFRLRGLDADTRYTVTEMDTKGVMEVSGRELKEDGLAVVIPDRPGAVIMTYKRRL